MMSMVAQSTAPKFTAMMEVVQMEYKQSLNIKGTPYTGLEVVMDDITPFTMLLEAVLNYLEVIFENYLFL